MDRSEVSPSEQISAVVEERDNARFALASKTREIEEFISRAHELSGSLARAIRQRDLMSEQLFTRTAELASSRHETADAKQSLVSAEGAATIANEATVAANQATVTANEATVTANEATVTANEATVTANAATVVANQATVTATKQRDCANEELATSQLSLVNKSAEFVQSQSDLDLLGLDLKNLHAELIKRTAQRIALGIEVSENIGVLTRLNAQLQGRAGELTEANKKLAQIMVSRDDFVAALTHDLKNPLIGCSQIISAMLDGHIAIEEQPQYLRLILDSTNSMLRMIWNLLTVYKDEHGRLIPAPNIVNLPHLLNGCVGEFIFRCSENGVNMVLQGIDEVGSVRTDQILLRRVLINLLDNAAKFAPKNSVIRIAASLTEFSEVRISILDSGCGMSKEHVDHIFEQFWQSNSSVQKNSTGMGLSVSKQIMHLLGGRIECNSAPGVGTDFILFLPMAISPLDTVGVPHP
ncbi:hypothetical protein BH10CYA1_BH10CYA1_16370 [soil metagenome]